MSKIFKDTSVLMSILDWGLRAAALTIIYYTLPANGSSINDVISLVEVQKGFVMTGLKP